MGNFRAGRWLVLLFLGLPGMGALASPGITYHGRLLKPNSTPVTSSNVQFKMQIRTPGIEDCLLYEEIQTKDLSSSSGVFAVSVGDGTGTRTDAHSSDWSLFDSLSNRQTFNFSTGECSGPTTYTPNASDNRRFRVFFDDGSGSGWQSMPTQTINYIPMSIETYAVGGFPASSLFRVEDAGVVGNVAALTTTQYNNLVDLADGSSSAYEKSGSLNGSTLPSIGSGESVRWNGTSWESYSPLESGDETDPTVQAFAKTSLPTCNTGEVLKSDGSVLSCVTDTSGTLPDVGTAGTYTKVTTDAKGRVTSGTTLSESDIPKLTSAGNGVDGGAISGTIGGSTSINTSGNITTTGNLSASGSATTGSFSTRLFDLYDSDNSNKISFLAPATGDLTSDYTLTLPVDAGASGQVLSTDGSGTLSWISPSTGSVTSVTGTSPITIIGTAGAPVVTLDDSGVGAATYGSATEVPVITVDSKGRITSASNTTISGVSPVGSTLSTGKAWLGDGTGKAAENYINVSDLKKSDGTNQIPLTCTDSQTLTYSAVTDLFSCTDISIAHTQVSGLSADHISNTAAGNLTSTDVQAALEELDSDLSSLNSDLSTDISGKVSKSGDTMSGNLDMDGHQILNISNVPFSSADPTISEDGKTLRWNNTSEAWEWFSPGVAGSGITSINGESGNSQTFVFGTSGTAPAIVSASDTHTLNIPMASGTGVTAGLISKTDYDAFNSKLSAVTGSTLTSTNIWVGDASNQAQPVTMSGDATLANDGALTLKNTGTAGTYGSATEIPIITTDAQGRVTGVTESSVTIPQDASDITNTPAGNIAATDVQAAINELDTEKVAKAGDTMTGTLNLPTNGLVVGTDQLVANSGNVGIGTASPGQKLDIQGTDSDVHVNIQNSSSTSARYPGVLVQNYTGGVGGAPSFTGLASRGTSGSPAPVQTGDTLFMLNGLGETDTSWHSGTGAIIQMQAAQTFSPTALGTHILFQNVANNSTTLQTRMFIGEDGNVGIGTTNPSEKLEVVGKIKATEICIGSDCQSSWPSAGGGGTVTEVTGTAPIQVATGTSTPVISVDDATTSAKGVVLLADDDGSDTTAGHVVQASDSRLQSISGKLSSTLNDGNIFVGNSSHVATGVSPSGDVSLTNAGAFKVLALQNVSISATAPTTSGQVLRYDGSGYAPSFVDVSDIRSDIGVGGGTPTFPTSCTASQTLTWSSLTNVFTCSNISITKSQVSDFPALGTAAVEDVGTGAGDVVQLDSSGKLPALDGSLLTNLSGLSFPLLAPLGSDSVPSYSFSGDSNTGIFSNGNEQIGFTSNGSESMRVTYESVEIGSAIGNGRAYLEVGSSTGLDPFIVGGPLTADGINALQVGNNSLSGEIKAKITVGKLSSDNNDLRFFSATGTPGNEVFTERLTIRGDSGNVGIGTTAPTERLHVSGGNIKVEGGTRLLDLDSSASGGFVYQTFRQSGVEDWWLVGNGVGKSLTFRSDPNGSAKEVLHLNYTGNIGIGTVNPTQPLDVYSTATGNPFISITDLDSGLTAPGFQAKSDNSTLQVIQGGSGAGSEGIVRTNGAGGLNLQSNSVTGDIKFSVNSSTAMVIRETGNVGIGTTNPAQKFQVGQSGDGTVAIANAWNTFSDIRLKKDIVPIKNACEMVDQLNGYYYHWKDGEDQSRQVGVIAQEVQKVLPELVSGGSDGILTVDYPKLSAVLIESVKELNSRIHVLEEQNKIILEMFCESHAHSKICQNQ